MPGYTNILIHPGQPYAALSPYDLRNEKGELLENLWQFAKLYSSVPAQDQWSYIAGYNGKVQIWSHPAEVHISREEGITQAYWQWRAKGFANKYAVRWPVGQQQSRNCLGSIWPIVVDDTLKDDGQPALKRLDYIAARKAIYFKLYRDMLDPAKSPHNQLAIQQMQELAARVRAGEKLQIVEVDGPSAGETAPYNKVLAGRIGDAGVASMPATLENLRAALNNPDKPFGHGFSIAWLLQEMLGVIPTDTLE